MNVTLQKLKMMSNEMKIKIEEMKEINERTLELIEQLQEFADQEKRKTRDMEHEIISLKRANAQLKKILSPYIGQTW